MNRLIYPILAALAVTGCTSATTSLKLSESHPANPTGPQSAYPPLTPFLMGDTNFVLISPASTNAPEPEHHHEAKPKHEHN
jgi:hypothetical protein